MAEDKTDLAELVAAGCGCLVLVVGGTLLLVVAAVNSCVASVTETFREGDGVGIAVILSLVALGVGIVIAAVASSSPEPARVVTAPAMPAADDRAFFRLERKHLALVAVLRFRPQAEPFVEFTGARRDFAQEPWRDAGLLRVGPLSEVLHETAAAWSAREALAVGQRYDEFLTFAEAYQLETWLVEQAAAGPRRTTAELEGPDPTAAYGQMHHYLRHLADAELRGALGDLLSVWHRDQLEGVTGAVTQEPAAVAATFQNLIDRYQQALRRAEESAGDEPAALQDQLNALGTALLQRVARCLAPPPEDYGTTDLDRQ